MSNIEQAFKANISLTFKFKNSSGSSKDYTIEPERISYVIIEHKYLNEHILPVIYLSLKLDSSLYSGVMNTQESSKFHLTIKKKNVNSKTSVYTKVVDDTFSYVTSTTTANYSSKLNEAAPDGSSYIGITVGLVSTTATNKLRQSFNGIYKNTSLHDLVNLATKDIPNLVKEDLKYNVTYESILIPPLTSVYKMLQYLFNKDAFYDSQFMFYMDFNKSYLISNHAQAVSAGDGDPTTVLVKVKDYTASDAYKEGFEINRSSGYYLVNVNANNTQVTINNATEKVATNIVGYSVNNNQVQNLEMDNYNEDNTTKRVYLKTQNAAASKNEINSSNVLIELVKQNLDSDIFTPNKIYKVTNYSEYSKYDGNYKLAYKKEAYYQNGGGGDFLVTSDVGLRLVGEEEVAYSVNSQQKDNTARKVGNTYTLKKSSTYKNTTTKATR